MSNQQENRSAYLKLSDKKRAFIDAYFACKFNATQAAIDAGYSAKTANEQAARLLANVSVKEAVEERRGEIEEQNRLKISEVVDELRRVGFSDITQVVEWSGNSIKIKNSADLPPEVRACISEVSETPGKHGSTIKVKFHNKVAALELLGRYLKMFTEKVELTGKDGEPVTVKPDLSKLDNDELRALLALSEKVTPK